MGEEISREISEAGFFAKIINSANNPVYFIAVLS
jgi:hypothetical protein